MCGGRNTGQEAAKGTKTLEKGQMPPMHPCSPKAHSPARTPLGHSQAGGGGEGLVASGGGPDVTQPPAAPIPRVDRPPLPKVTALQGCTRGLASYQPCVVPATGATCSSPSPVPPAGPLQAPYVVSLPRAPPELHGLHPVSWLGRVTPAFCSGSRDSERGGGEAVGDITATCVTLPNPDSRGGQHGLPRPRLRTTARSHR